MGREPRIFAIVDIEKIFPPSVLSVMTMRSNKEN
jgi:hypothetical protein